MKQVFLSGTCGNNQWRDDVIKKLLESGVASERIFNPVVKDWNADCQAREEAAKKDADYLLYYIADPKQDGLNISAYSLVEATMALYDKCDRTVLVFDVDGLSTHATKAMQQAQTAFRSRTFSRTASLPMREKILRVGSRDLIVKQRYNDHGD